jgi:hypothetical protein
MLKAKKTRSKTKKSVDGATKETADAVEKIAATSKQKLIKIQRASSDQKPENSVNAIRQAIKRSVEEEPEPQAAPAAAPAIKAETSLKDRPDLAKQEVIKVINEEIKKKADDGNAVTLAVPPVKPDFRGFNKMTPTPVEQKMINELGAPATRPVSIYKKISLSFLVLTVLLLAGLFYYSFVKVTITIEPKATAVSGKLPLDIYDEATAPSKDGGIVGVVKEVELTTEQSYPATGGLTLGEEAIGKVNIVNNYIKNQPLVATTRLLTADNKLFRLKDTINVPAGGSVEAEIYADQPSAEMAVGPTKFTIPGLWAGLQDKVYGESSEPVVYRQKKQSVIQQIDIDSGTKDLKDQLLKKVESEAVAGFKDKYKQVLYKFDENSINVTTDGNAGDEKESINIKLTAKVDVVAFNDDASKKLAEQKMKSSIAENQELVEFNQDKIVYGLSSVDTANGTAAVEASFEGRALPKAGASLVDKQKLVGLSGDQLNQYLAGLPEVASFEVKFSPEFFKRAPYSADRIIVELKK